MKVNTFINFWDKWTSTWIESAKCFEVDKKDTFFPVKEKCRIPKTAATSVYQKYQCLKSISKGIYFNTPRNKSSDDFKLSRYKRAAVIIQAVLETDCLVYFEKDSHEDSFLLKERLAFFLGIASIIQSFPATKVDNILNSKQTPIYQFDELDIDREEDADNFLQSVYKDLFFSRFIGNYNVLTMANLLGVLTERASLLSEIIKPDTKTNDENINS